MNYTNLNNQAATLYTALISQNAAGSPSSLMLYATKTFTHLLIASH